MHADPLTWRGILLILVALVVSDIFGRRLSRRVATICLAIGVALLLVAEVLDWIARKPETFSLVIAFGLGWSAIAGGCFCAAGIKGLYMNWERKRGKGDAL